MSGKAVKINKHITSVLLGFAILSFIVLGSIVALQFIASSLLVTSSAQVPMSPMDTINFQFLDAARTGNIALMKTLLATGADINTARIHYGDIGSYSENALNNAMSSKNEEAVLFLLKNNVLYEKDNLLQDAYRQKYEQVVKFALSKKPSTEALASALSQGAGQNYEKQWLKLLVDAGTNPDSAMQSAVQYASGVESTQALLDLGANVNSIVSPNYGYTPLFLTANYAHFTNSSGEARIPTPRTQALKAKLLIARGADVNKRDNYGFTPFINAAVKGNIKVLEVLLGAGVPVDQRDTRKDTNPFENQRTNRLSTGIYSKILDTITTTSSYYKSGPFWAPKLSTTISEEKLKKIFGHKIANLGLPSNVPIEMARGPFGGTALMWVAFSQGGDNEDTLRFLVQHGANLNARDRYNATPLMYASASEDFAYNTGLFTLLDLNADINAVDRFGNNSAMYNLLYMHNDYWRGAHYNQLKGLIVHGVSLDQKNSAGISVRSLKPDIEQLMANNELIQNKTDFEFDNPEKTKIELTKANHHNEEVYILSHRGGKREDCLKVMYLQERCTLDVDLEKVDKPLTLVLAGNTPARWKIHNGQNVKKLYLSGRFRQTISGLPHQTNIINTSYQDGDLDYFDKAMDFLNH